MKKIDYRKIDREFHPLIKELNKVGLETTQCCCGHKGRKLAFISMSLAKIQDVAIRDNGKRLIIWWNREGREKNITNW